MEFEEEGPISIIMLKPDSFPVDQSWLDTQNIIENFIDHNNLSILQILEKELSQKEILSLYHEMYKEKDIEKISPNLGRIRWELMEYMLSWKVRSYLLEWDDAPNHVLTIKKHIRETLYRKNLSRESVKNVIHVPEINEIEINKSILFSPRHV